uniref:Vesicle transport protein n=1 Tax=Parascaris equorum TaxID=6256 RepID=A0A914S4K1_PAREQ
MTDSVDNETILSNPTELQRSYEGWLTITSGISCLFGSLFNFLTTERLNHNFRIIFGHIFVFLSLMPTILFTFVCTDYVQELFLWLSVLLAAVACFGSAGLLGCGLLGYSARFPAVYVCHKFENL